MTTNEALKILGIDGLLTEAVLKSAFRLCVKRLHPDVQSNVGESYKVNDSEELQRVFEANECLREYLNNKRKGYLIHRSLFKFEYVENETIFK